VLSDFPRRKAKMNIRKSELSSLALQTVERVTTLSHVLRSDTDMKML